MTVKKRYIGKTNVEVSELGFGTAPLGGWPVEVSDKNAQSSLQKAWDLGIRYFDTAPLYGSGQTAHAQSSQLLCLPCSSLQAEPCPHRAR